MAIEKHVGAKYNEKLSTAQVAALLRAEIKAAQKTGKLPPMAVSVTSKKYSMGSSIDVRVSAAAVFFNPNQEQWSSRLSPEGNAVHETLTAMGRAYLRSETEGVSDYNHSSFHYFVSIGRA